MHTSVRNSLIILLLSLPMLSWADTLSKAPFSVCDGSRNAPCIVLESDQASQPVPCLRHSYLINRYYQGDRSGVENLRTSASAAPTSQGWRLITNYIDQQLNYHQSPVYVIDLREESHGYLNGLPITLMSEHNWINLGKSSFESSRDELNWLRELNTLKTVNHVLSPVEYEIKDYQTGRDIPVESISDEATEVLGAGMNYLRLNVSDHRRPRDEVVDEFMRFFQQRPKDSWLHFHCRGGKGRSSTFLAMVDMLINADRVSFEEIIARQASVPPYYDLRVVKKQDPALTPYYKERLAFLGQFYRYSQALKQGYQGSWTEWLELEFPAFMKP